MSPTTIARYGALAWLIALFLSACGGPTSQAPERVIVVPTTATSEVPYRGDGSVPPRRYVVRMSDGARDWEVELPEGAAGYQLRIPLNARDEVALEGDPLTAADRAIIEQNRRMNPQTGQRNPDMERDGLFAQGRDVTIPRAGAEPLLEEGEGGIDPWTGLEGASAPTRQSYLLGLEKVRRAYKAGRYEIALVTLTELDEQYPNDPTILSMMGTLYKKLGQPELARGAWERVLQFEPENRAVLDAMRQLAGDPQAADPQE